MNLGPLGAEEKLKLIKNINDGWLGHLMDGAIVDISQESMLLKKLE